MRIMGKLPENQRKVGLAAAAAAVGLGLCYLTAAGAPVRYLALNLAAFVVGAAAYATVTMPRWHPGSIAALMLPALGVALLATALLGTPVEGASRWLTLGPLNLQPSLILLPAMLVAFAARPTASGSLGLVLAVLALALQPDRAMAGVLVAGLAALALRRRNSAVLSALAAALAAFVATLLRPDALPAVPYVDQILFTSFAVHPLAGAAVIAGATILLLPALAGRRDAASLVFGIVWLAIVLAAALGNYPTPLVGYGGSAIVGYLLSIAFLEPHPIARQVARETAGGTTGNESGPALFLAEPGFLTSRVT